MSNTVHKRGAVPTQCVPTAVILLRLLARVVVDIMVLGERHRREILSFEPVRHYIVLII